MIKIKSFYSVEELESISQEWDTLLSQSINNTIALSWDWISNWIKVYLGSDKLLCLAVYDGNKLVAVAPLLVQEKRYLGFFKIRVLRFIGSGEICPDHLDFIISGKYINKVPGLIWDYLFGRLRNHWDIWEYENIPSDSKILHAFFQNGKDDNRCLRAEIDGYMICPYVLLPDSWETYLASLSSNQRRALRVSTDLIEKAGRMEVEFCEDLSTLDEDLKTHILLHRMSWEDRGQSGSYNSKDFVTFHHNFAENCLSQKKLMLCTLKLNGNAIGSFYGFEYDRILYYYLLGVDRSAVPRASIGRVVLGYCIKEAIERGCIEFDLLRGFESYKYDWTDRERREWLVTFYNRSAGAAYFLVKNYLKQILKLFIQFIFGKAES